MSADVVALSNVVSLAAARRKKIINENIARLLSPGQMSRADSLEFVRLEGAKVVSIGFVPDLQGGA